MHHLKRKTSRLVQWVAYLMRAALLIGLITGVAYANDATQGLSFPAVLKQVLAEHPSIYNKQSDIAVANTQIEIAQWSYWPTPSITHQHTEALGSGNITNQNQTVLSLEQPIWKGGALDAGLEQAKASKKETQASLQRARMEVTLQTVNAFGQAFAAKKSLAAKQRYVDLLQSLYDQIKRRADSGLSPLSDVRLAEGRIRSAESGLLSTQTNFQNAKESLYALIGTKVDMDFDSFENNALSWDNLPEDIKTAIAIDPVTAEIREQVSKLRWSAKQVQASAWPSVSLVVSRTLNDQSSNGNSFAYLNIESDWSAGLSVVSRSDSAEQKILSKINEIDFQLRQVENNIRSDYLQNESASTNITTLEGALGASKSIFDSWNRQFRAGRKSWQEVMDSAKEQEGIESMIASAYSIVSTTSWRLAARVNGVDWLITQRD